MHAEEGLERRIVTVLFADLVGFTTLSERLDAEDVATIQDRYFAAVRDTIGRYGGRLEKFIGDAAMAAFGVPIARDDDAERAVRAGLALVHAVQDLGAQLGIEEDVLHLRVGINTGEAVVAISGTDEGRITGDTVNTAARFQTAAPPDGVLIGETTALAVGDIAELGEQQRLELKGKSKPVGARLVAGFRSEPSREQAMGALRAPTIGRATELDKLSRAIDRAAGGATERWVVVAPPGVGKTRVLREVASSAAARSDLVIWRSRARPGSVSPFDAIAGLLLSAIGSDGAQIAEAADIEQRLVARGMAAARASVVAGVCSSLLFPHGADGNVRQTTDDRDALFAAWLDGLDALAGDSTQVWLVEDVHWAGGDVLAFVDLAGSRSSRAGRLIVATARPSLLESHVEWATDEVDRGRNVLRLATLQPASAHELIAALVGEALPTELVERIVERSDGNCLFIEELLRTWVSVGTLVQDDSGRWRLSVPAEE
ncbi:MAG TPA: adenylate/guanylate cyclase domain-containing protein, partial [Candidatus Limnocylindrales bacterium]